MSTPLRFLTQDEWNQRRLARRKQNAEKRDEYRARLQPLVNLLSQKMIRLLREYTVAAYGGEASHVITHFWDESGDDTIEYIWVNRYGTSIQLILDPDHPNERIVKAQIRFECEGSIVDAYQSQERAREMERLFHALMLPESSLGQGTNGISWQMRPGPTYIFASYYG